MTAKLSILLALIASQATAFFVADKNSNKALLVGPLAASTYNRNYDGPGMGPGMMGGPGMQGM